MSGVRAPVLEKDFLGLGFGGLGSGVEKVRGVMLEFKLRLKGFGVC